MWVVRLREDQTIATISTHILDTVRGAPAAGVGVTLTYLEDGDMAMTSTSTDEDGRVSDLLDGRRLLAGSYRLTFDTGAYGNPFYPTVTVTFQVNDPGQHHHVPLLLSEYGYTTYRGS